MKHQLLDQNLHGYNVLYDLALPILHLFPLLSRPIPPALSEPFTLFFFPLAHQHPCFIICYCITSPWTPVTRINRPLVILWVDCPQLGGPFLLGDVCQDCSHVKVLPGKTTGPHGQQQGVQLRQSVRGYISQGSPEKQNQEAMYVKYLS